MDFDKQTSTIASILTAGYLINTEMEIEDLDGAVKIYNGVGEEYMKRLKEYSERQLKEGSFVNQPEELDMISAILAAGQIVNTTTHSEDVAEMLDIYEEFRELYKNTEDRAPLLLKTKTYLNIAAAILVAGLIVNTSDWEETPQESTVLYTQCMQKLTSF